MIGWNFPSNGGGQIRGISDAGIQTFSGREIFSLAREICQNSLDAAVDENFAVTVEFRRHEINTWAIPDYRNYKEILRSCRELWKDNDKTKQFFDAAISQIESPKNFVLRISDFNTTGLADPFDPCALDGWNALTKIDGGATKTGDAAGSFGIGKNAPFTNSFYRLIFYRTLNSDSKHAAQGMSRIVSFKLANGEYSAGVGYYGEPNGNLPVEKIVELDEIYEREQTGTDVFVYGFNGGDDWREKISVELLENFLVAIHNDKLRVKIQSENLTCDTLKKFILRYADKLKHAPDYYRVLAGGDNVKTFTKNFHGMGTLKLRVVVDSRTSLNRRVLVVRKNGMKLFDLARISGTLSFTGILELEGHKLNEFFREMETPSHDNWEPGRHKNPSVAKSIFTELKQWVRKTISNIGAEDFSDEVDVEGLGQMLSFDDSAIDSSNETIQETLDLQPISENSSQELLPSVEKISNTLSAAGDNENSATRQTRGDITDNDGLSAVRIPKGTRKRKKIENHTGEKNPDGADIVKEPVDKKIFFNKVRVIKLGDKNYRLILGLPQNVSAGRIEIFVVGEDGKRISGDDGGFEKLFVTKASSADSKIKILSVGDKIAFQNLRSNTEAKINFELRDRQNYALEVDICED